MALSKDDTHIDLQSKAGQPLARFLPDVATSLRRIERRGGGAMKRLAAV